MYHRYATPIRTLTTAIVALFLLGCSEDEPSGTDPEDRQIIDPATRLLAESAGSYTGNATIIEVDNRRERTIPPVNMNLVFTEGGQLILQIQNEVNILVSPILVLDNEYGFDIEIASGTVDFRGTTSGYTITGLRNHEVATQKFHGRYDAEKNQLLLDFVYTYEELSSFIDEEVIWIFTKDR